MELQLFLYFAWERDKKQQLQIRAIPIYGKAIAIAISNSIMKWPYFARKTRPKSNGPYRKKWEKVIQQNSTEKIERRQPRRRSRRHHGTKNPGNRGKGKRTVNSHVMTISLRRDAKLKVEGKFMITNWSGTDAMNSIEGVSIEEFDVVDSTDNKSVQAFDVLDPGICLFGKLSRRLCVEHLIQKRRRGIKLLRDFGMQAMTCKPNVLRGAKCGGLNTAYKIFGTRKEPLTKGVGKYAFKPKTTNEDKNNIEVMAEQIVNSLEKAANLMSNALIDERSFAQSIRKCTPHLSTAFSVGRDYHSKCHVDNDYYYTLLTVAAPTKALDNTIIYYFCFPEYSVKVPLRSGDVLLFNPQIFHSCSNPKLPGSFIMSAYVSAKTIHSMP